MNKSPDTIDTYARQIAEQLVEFSGFPPELSESVRERVLSAVFKNQELERKLSNGGTIQSFNVRADIASGVLSHLGATRMQVMAMGDIWPTPRVFNELLAVEAEVFLKKLEILMGKGPRGYSYDDFCKGEVNARRAMFENFAPSYGFEDAQIDELIENSSIIEGGMNGIESVFGAFFSRAMMDGKTPRVICPDSTFAMFWDIIRETKNSDRIQSHKIGTSQSDRLHLTGQNVDDFYRENGGEPDKVVDLWYMIPLGNPSGTSPRPEQLKETCSEIIKNNPEAVIVLDCAYIRTMEDADATGLISVATQNPEIMDRVIFIDSLSKTHAVPESRLGTFFSQNPALYNLVQDHDKSKRQGHSTEKSAKIEALLAKDDHRAEMFKDMHRFRGRERQGLFKFLVESGRFDDLFHEDQSHIDTSALTRPGGIYLFPRMKEGVSFLDVAGRTNCFGISSKLASGNYIRFAVGRITEPTFSEASPSEWSG